ncbi:MAG: tetratricopeptide repeat protein [Cyclobacteriaceae bacterium]|jgi:tetratricopeptide (TPR) repeat protein|nr:tetratricopeptide repeat protein [Cyclobacteriaceae bacterium]
MKYSNQYLLFILCFVSSITISIAQSTLQKGKTAYESNKKAEAKKILATIDDDKSDYAEAQYILGRIAFDEQDYESAADFFEEASDTNPKNPDYHNWYGNALGNIAKDANPLRQGMLAPKMKAAWEKAIELDAKNMDARLSLIEYYTQAPSFMGGSYEKAHQMASQIKKIDLAEGHRAAGNIYYREKKITEAEKEFIAMAKVDPKKISGLASFYAQQKQYEKAFAIYEEELKKDNSNMSVVYQLGRLSAVSGLKLEQGEMHLKKYLAYQPQKNEPTHAGAYMRLGNIYEKKGNKAEAKQAYSLSLKLDPNTKEAKEGMERVK